MEKEHFVTESHENIEKKRQKAWHYHHVKNNHFKVKGLVLLYGRKMLKHSRKLKTHWLGPYVIIHITKVGAVKLHKMDGTPVMGMIHGSHLKPYHDGCDTAR